MGIIIFGPIYLMIFIIEAFACSVVFASGGSGSKSKGKNRRRNKGRRRAC